MKQGHWLAGSGNLVFKERRKLTGQLFVVNNRGHGDVPRSRQLVSGRPRQ